MKRVRSLVVLGGLVLVVAALWWWDQRRGGVDEDQLFPGLDRGAVRAVTIERDGAKVVIERDGAAWRAGGVRADGDAVDQLLGAMEFERVARRVGRDPVLARKVGLAPGRLRVTVAGRSLTIGGDAPGGRAMYVERDGAVLVADRRIAEVADRAPERWRLMRPLLSDTGAIRTLQIGAVKLAREGEAWTVDGAPAEPHGVDRLLDAVDKARATKLSPVGADELDRRIHSSEGTALTVNGTLEARVDGSCDPGTRVTRADGAVLCFDDAALKPLLQTASQLKEPRLFPLPIAAVTDVELRDGAERLALHREGGTWRIVAPLDAAGPADDPSVRAWLEELTALSGEGGSQRLTLRTPEASATHAVRGQSTDPLRFHDRRVIDLQPDALDRLTVDGYTIVRQRHGGAPDSYEVDPPVPVDDEALRTLFETFAQLRVQAFDREARPATRTITGAGKVLHLHGCAGDTAGLSFTLDERTCESLSVAIGR